MITRSHLTMSVTAEGKINCAALLSQLPEEDQDLYRLYFTEGYSQEEIAEMKGVSQNTISKKLRRIQKTLTEMCRNEV